MQDQLVYLPVGRPANLVADAATAVLMDNTHHDPKYADVIQLTLCVNIVYLLVLSTTTLPLYSLVVQMGSDFKGSLPAPPDVRSRLEAAAAEVWHHVASCAH